MDAVIRSSETGSERRWIRAQQAGIAAILAIVPLEIIAETKMRAGALAVMTLHLLNILPWIAFVLALMFLSIRRRGSKEPLTLEVRRLLMRGLAVLLVITLLLYALLPVGHSLRTGLFPVWIFAPAFASCVTWDYLRTLAARFQWRVLYVCAALLFWVFVAVLLLGNPFTYGIFRRFNLAGVHVNAVGYPRMLPAFAESVYSNFWYLVVGVNTRQISWLAPIFTIICIITLVSFLYELTKVRAIVQTNPSSFET